MHEDDTVDKDDNEEEEEGEINEDEVHPLVQITKIDPDDIPEVSNKFLMRQNRNSASRNDKSKERDDKSTDKRKDRDRRDSGNKNK